MRRAEASKAELLWRSFSCFAELENNIGISEKTLAEFIIKLAEGKRSVKDFSRVREPQHATSSAFLVFRCTLEVLQVSQHLNRVYCISPEC